MAEPVTMAEIDALRGEAEKILTLSRCAREDGRAQLRALLDVKRERIEKLLRRWWAQGCREVPRG